jgi:LAO/AO transport system kinase
LPGFKGRRYGVRMIRAAAASPVFDIPALCEGLLAGQRKALARAITLVESTRADHQALAADLLSRILPHAGGATRLGITGTPGVGKSTFIEAFGRHLTGQGLKVAVLAVDPSSARSGGSILGDKTRMEELARDPNAFIRPSPSGTTLGGVARRTREAMILVEAAGFDVVLVETVGVGQSETAVADMVDMFLLLLAPGGGDDLQGIKRGIMELADLVIINKADGDLLRTARISQTDYLHALRLMRPRTPLWHPDVLLASAREGQGINEIWSAIGRFRTALTGPGEWARRRAEQSLAWMWRELSDGLVDALRADAVTAQRLVEMEARVRAGEVTPTAAARGLLAEFLDRGRKQQ